MFLADRQTLSLSLIYLFIFIYLFINIYFLLSGCYQLIPTLFIQKSWFWSAWRAFSAVLLQTNICLEVKMDTPGEYTKPRLTARHAWQIVSVLLVWMSMVRERKHSYTGPALSLVLFILAQTLSETWMVSTVCNCNHKHSDFKLRTIFLEWYKIHLHIFIYSESTKIYTT